MNEEVRRTYAKVMNMRRHLGNVEMEAAVSELMIAVMNDTAKTVRDIYNRDGRVFLTQEIQTALIDLRSSLRRLQHSLEAPQTDLRSS